MSEITLTPAGQYLRWFSVKTDIISGEKAMHEKIMDFASEHDLVIDQIDYNWAKRYAYVLFSKRNKGTCAECNGECLASDYLCQLCRIKT